MPGAGTLPNKPGKTNWVEKAGGLPRYIERIAKHLYDQHGDEGRAIAEAVNTVKRWAAGGTVRPNGGPKVNPDTQAKAAAALAEWERKRKSGSKNLSLAISMHVHGETIGAERALTLVSALESGDSAGFSHGVRVQAVDDDEDGSYYLVTGGYYGDDDGGQIRIVHSPEDAVTAAAAYVQACKEREQAKQAEYTAPMMSEQASFSQQPFDPLEYQAALLLARSNPRQKGLRSGVKSGILSGMNLAQPITFNPADHPRDLKGRFRGIVGGLKVGQAVQLPDRTTVARTKDGFMIAGGQRTIHTKLSGVAADSALEQSANSTKPESLGGGVKHRTVEDAARAEKGHSSRQPPASGPSSDEQKSMVQEFGDAEVEAVLADYTDENGVIADEGYNAVAEYAPSFPQVALDNNPELADAGATVQGNKLVLADGTAFWIDEGDASVQEGRADPKSSSGGPESALSHEEIASHITSMEVGAEDTINGKTVKRLKKANTWSVDGDKLTGRANVVDQVRGRDVTPGTPRADQLAGQNEDQTAVQDLQDHLDQAKSYYDEAEQEGHLDDFEEAFMGEERLADWADQEGWDVNDDGTVTLPSGTKLRYAGKGQVETVGAK